MKKSTVPPALLPGSGIVSASLLAQIMHSKYVLALPLYRQEQELRRLGLPVSRQTMSNWVLTAGERWLLPVYHVLHKELLANEILHADETTLMVLREPERQALADELGEDGIQELAQRYAEAYEGCYDGAELDAYIEEICADAYAGMDRLPEAKTQIIQKAARQAQDAQQAAEENGGTRGPPEKYSMVGYGSNGLKTYKSDFSSDMTATEKQEYLYSLIKSVWSKKPLQLTILQNGKERSISARFDGESNGQEFAGKMAFGNRRGTRTERLISLNLADDIWEIASESTYDASKGGIKETLTLFKAMLTDHRIETMMKQCRYGHVRHFIDHPRHLETCWNAYKIANRNHYLITDIGKWADYICMLVEMGKDIRSPHYICPDNLEAEHDRISEKIRAKKEKERTEEEIRKALKNEDKFKEMKSRFFGLMFTDGNIVVRMLESVREHVLEGKAMLTDHRIETMMKQCRYVHVRHFIDHPRHLETCWNEGCYCRSLYDKF